MDDLMLKNAALLFKWWWRFMTEEGSFWTKVISSIHRGGISCMLSYKIPQTPGSMATYQEPGNETNSFGSQAAPENTGWTWLEYQILGGLVDIR